MMAKKTIAMLYCVVSVLFGLNSKAISQDSAYQTLMGNSAFECRFLIGKTAVITEVGKPLEFKQDGTIIASKGEWTFNEKVDKGFPSITFRQIQRGEGLSLTAQMIGNTGNISQVEGFLGAQYRTFVEAIMMGGITVTTIFAEFDGRHELIAVHSRHSRVFPSKVIASQYYGSCRPIAP
jgi:hypothetical protein